MTDDTIKGSCLCGEVAYQISGNLGIFQYCHCSRCRKFTGSAFAANMLIRPEHFKWVRGEDSVGQFALPGTRHFATAFCTRCGSSLPWRAQSGNTVVIPAGTLDDDPGLRPKMNIFKAFSAGWYEDPGRLPEFDGLPVK